VTNDIEDRLRQLLRDRADTITVAPDYRTVPVRPDRHVRKWGAVGTRDPKRSWQWSTAILAAAVAVLVAIVVVRPHGTSPNPVGTRQPCQPGHSPGFAAALRAGRLTGANEVLAGAPDGTELVATENGNATASVHLVAPDGTTRLLWRQRSDQVGRAFANPSGAIGSSVVSFGIAPVDPATGAVAASTRRLYVATRHGGAAIALPPPDRGFAVPTTDSLTAPVAGDDSVTVLERSMSRPARQRLITYQGGPGLWRRVSARRVSAHVIQLLSAGGNLITISRSARGAAHLSFAEPQYQPTDLEPAARDGVAFFSDGTTLSWFTQQGGQAVVWSWRPGEPVPVARGMPAGFTPETIGGSGVVAGRFDRALARIAVLTPGHRVAELPAAVDLLRLDGGFAVLNDKRVALTRVPLGALTDCGH
jgi:hypothetical protein